MPLMTAEQYEESLRKLDLLVYMFGKRVENPVDDPIIRPSMQAKQWVSSAGWHGTRRPGSR